MANKMLIDSTHPEETRVVVLRGNRVEEFDFESANRRQLRGNIYLAKVTRVEPSLQAAFVDYGGNRHGFLAFSEIHPDYYQIPVADRQALIEAEERAHRDAEEEIDRRAAGGGRNRRPRREAAHERSDARRSEALEASDTDAGNGEPHEHGEHQAEQVETNGAESTGAGESAEAAPDVHQAAPPVAEAAPEPVTDAPEAQAVPAEEHHEDDHHEPQIAAAEPVSASEFHEGEPATASENGESHDGGENNIVEVEEPATAENGEEVVESVGGADALEEVQERTPRYRRSYKIQEVIKRRQIMLVQVVKEERGTKGAALTTYLSLAGRYSVLMPNTARGGGISRKITSALDR
jgi:ribonuclease E